MIARDLSIHSCSPKNPMLFSNSEMASSNSCRIITRLSFTIRFQLIANDCDCEIDTNLDWIINDNSVIRPDLMVVCGEQPERHLERPLALAVEVLSESTRGRDLIAKRFLCRENIIWPLIRYRVH